MIINIIVSGIPRTFNIIVMYMITICRVSTAFRVYTTIMYVRQVVVGREIGEED